MENDGLEIAGDSRLRSDLEEFRAAARAAAERPEAFWAGQRRSVMARVGLPPKTGRLRPAMAWGVAAAVVLAAVGLWMDGPRALPAPDFAAGYDDDLLGEVERLTDVDAPIAFEPAMMLAGEIEAGIMQNMPAKSAPVDGTAGSKK